MSVKIRGELLQSQFTRPDWSKNTSRNNTLLFLDKNENMDFIYTNFLKKELSRLELNELSYYPDCFLLYEKLANYLNVSIDQLLLGSGSDGVIRYAFEAFVSRGDSVVFTDPSFAMYSVYGQMFGAKVHPVGYIKEENSLSLNVECFLKKIHEYHPTLVCLPNPDSPTGTMVSEEILVKIIEAATKVGAAVLIDEAYYPFNEYTALPLINIYSNLIIARTFSKAWGLAGARVGYAIANSSLIAIMHKVRPMYEIGAVSTALVIKALDYGREMLQSVERLNKGKEYFKKKMEQFNFKTLNTAGNFQHIAFERYASMIHQQLSHSVLYRHDFPDTVLSGYSRFSATTKETFEPVIKSIEAVMQNRLHLV